MSTGALTSQSSGLLTRIYYEELSELSEHASLTLQEVGQYIGWTPNTREEAGLMTRLCTQYGIQTTEDWLVWVEKL